MADPEQKNVTPRSSSGDRRGPERRKQDRRTPPPLWRSPAAYVAYGVVGALILVLFVSGDDEPELTVEAAEQTAVAEEYQPRAVPAGSVRDAPTVPHYEALIAEGDDAVGQIVRTELYCESIMAVAVSVPDTVLAPLMDGEGRVPGAACRWSREARSEDFLLIVPPQLAEPFARAPEVELNFVQRRRLPAELEWLGRSEAVALRNAGVLRQILP